MNDPFDDQLRRLFSGYEPEPHRESWEFIQASIRSRRRWRVPPVWVSMLSTGIILIAGLWVSRTKLSVSSSQGVKPMASGLSTPRHQGQKERLTLRVSPLPEGEKSSASSSRLPAGSRPALQRQLAERRQQPHFAVLHVSGSVPVSNRIQIEPKPAVAASSRLAILLPTSKPDELKVSFRMPEIVYEAPGSTTTVRWRPRISVWAGLMPFQVYNQYSILPQTAYPIHSVERSALLDGERFGGQFSVMGAVGLTPRSRLRLGVSAGRIQEVIRYRVSLPQYSVRLANTGFEIDQQTQAQALNRVRTTLALQADYHYSLPTKKPLFIAVGGDLVQDQPSGQTLPYLRLSVGMQRAVLGKSAIWVEPTVRYGLGTQHVEQPEMRLRPYTVGIQIGVSFP